MAVYLDEQLDDEPLFGIVARYLEMSPSISISRMVAFLYGAEVSASLMGRNYGHVAAQTQSCWGLSPEEIIRRMTLFPYIASLIDQVRAADLHREMIASSSRGHNRRGIWPPIGRKQYRYCMRCISENREQGVPMHWRRTHQLPGVIMCVHHGEFLWGHNFSNIDHYLRFVTPTIARDMGVSKIVSNSMNVRAEAAWLHARISHELLIGEVSIDRRNLYERFSRITRKRLGCYSEGKYQESVLLLIENCFGTDYLKCAGFGARKSAIWTERSRFETSRASWIVLCSSLMQLVEQDPDLLDERHFKAIYDDVSSDSVKRWPRRRVRPPVTCPNTLAAHGVGHIVERTAWRDSTLQCACSCGMRFRCAELSVGIGPPQITRWGDAYVREVGRLRDAGYSNVDISKKLGLPMRTIFNMYADLGDIN